jgi:hypothetical protein
MKSKGEWDMKRRSKQKEAVSEAPGAAEFTGVGGEANPFAGTVTPRGQEDIAATDSISGIVEAVTGQFTEEEK